MQAIMYKVKVTMSALDAARGWETTVREVWVARPGGKSFCFNNQNGLFFCGEPRNSEQMPDPATVEIDSTAVQRAVDFLDARDKLMSVFEETPRSTEQANDGQ